MKKIAVITGASSGMGKEFVIQLSARLKQVDEIWVIARRTGKLFELESRVRQKLVVCPADLSKAEDLQSIWQLLEKERPGIQILVNAAGIGVHGEFAKQDSKKSLEILEVNCLALTSITNMCLPYMIKGGRIIQLASSAAFVPQPLFAVYAASKSYVLNFSRALNAELAPRKISVTAVCPGPVDTEFFQHDDCNYNKTFYKQMVMAKPQDVVKQAIADCAKRKEISIYGNMMKGFYLITKLIPHRVLLGIMKILFR